MTPGRPEPHPYAANHPRYGHMGQAERAWTMRRDGLHLEGVDRFYADEHEAGLVRGHHFVTWSEEVARLKREARYEEPSTLLLEIIGATEAEQAVAQSHAAAKAASYGVALPVSEARETPPGWTQHAAIIYRKIGDLESEIAIIDRWEAHAGSTSQWVGVTHEKLLRRREKARELIRQRRSGPDPEAESMRPDKCGPSGLLATYTGPTIRLISRPRFPQTWPGRPSA